MSVGLGLFHRLIEEERPLSSITEAGIHLDTLTDSEAKVHDFIQEHVALYGALPRITTVEAETGVNFPEFPEEPFGYWVDGVLRRGVSKLLISAAKEIRDGVTAGDLDTAKEKARLLVSELNRRDPVDRITTLQSIATNVLEEHDQRRNMVTIAGVPFGIPYIDRVSDGAQPGDTIALVGRPGTGKTYFLLRMALAGYDAGFPPLVVTMEMKPVQVARRLIALRTGTSATRIRVGRLSHWSRARVADGVHELNAPGKLPFFIMEGGLRTTVEDLALRVQELRPGALYVDGAYLLWTKNKHGARWERIAEGAEVLKMVAREFGIPVIKTYQFNRKGSGSLGNIGGSDAVGQLASIVIALEDNKGNKDGQSSWEIRQKKLLKLIKGREGERGTVEVIYDMERMRIEQDVVLSGEDDEDQFTEQEEEIHE